VADIRPLTRDDIPQITSLYEHVARSGSRTPPSELAGYFADTFLDHPWADPEIPSLVYQEEDGTIAGFLGSSVRRLLFDGKPVRACVSGQLVTEPRIRSQAAGVFLTRTCMAGPQDLTLTDGASPTVEQMWDRLGGEAFQIACVGWLRVFRPWHFTVDLVARRRNRERASAGRPFWSLLDSMTTRLPGAPLRPPRSESTGEPLTPGAVMKHLPQVSESFRVRPDYDDDFLEWLFGEMAAVTRRGTLVSRLVRDRNRRVQGWYVYYLRRGGIGDVLQIVGGGRDVDDVVDNLFQDAWANGAAGLQGRVEAHLRVPLSRRRCAFYGSGSLALIHSREPELLHAIQSGRALLTRMEGEWWMGHHLQPFHREAPA
jgi:hypothetical protein